VPLRVKNLSLHYGIDSFSDERSSFSYLRGIANSDHSFGVVNDDETPRTSRLSCTLQRCDADAPQVWQTSLSFFDADAEIGNPDEWWVQIYLPADVFDDIVAQLLAKRVRSLQIHFRSNLLVARGASWFPISDNTRWYLAPRPADGRMPG